MRQHRKEVTPFFNHAQEFFNRLNDEGLLQQLLDFIYGPVRHREKGAQQARFLLEDINRHELSLSPAEELSLAQACQRVGATQEAAVFFERYLALPVDSETADAEIYLPRWRVHAALAQIYLGQGFPEKASPHLTACLEFRDDIPEALGEKLEQEAVAVAQKLSPSKRALLIGIDEYRYARRLHQGFTKDVDAWKGALAKMGYAAKDITILKDQRATRENILKEFDALAKHAENFPAFFFFAGKGTRDSSGSNMALLAVNLDKENPQPSPVTFQELASRSKNARHLTVVCDATFSDKSTASSYGPSSPDPIQEQPAITYFGKSMIDTPFGNTCILSGSKAESGGHVPTYSRTETENGGAFSQQLIKAAEANSNSLTPAELIQKMIADNVSV
jgi:tetratricopeptide (TPR) repeat protein